MKQKYKPKHKYKLGALIGSILLANSTQADVKVDTELLLLVDVSGSVDSGEYNLMMQGYTDAFRNLDIVDAVSQGPEGSIAVALMFWSASTQQQVGVDWMKIDDTASASAFADAIAATSRPFSSMTAIGSAITAGTELFGTETGGAVSNGFQSTVQLIDISGDGEDNNTPPDLDRAQNVRVARDAAIASGVDMINGLPIGNAGGDLEQYYIDNVIAGSIEGVEAFTQPVAGFSNVAESLELKLSREIKVGAVTAASVPEPSSVILIGVGAMAFILRRKRN